MAPPVTETHDIVNKGAEGGDISGSSEHRDSKELSTAEKAALTKLKNAQRVIDLEDNVDHIFQTTKQLSTSVSDIAARQDGFPDLISNIITQNLRDILKPERDTSLSDLARPLPQEPPATERARQHSNAPPAEKPSKKAYSLDNGTSVPDRQKLPQNTATIDRHQALYNPAHIAGLGTHRTDRDRKAHSAFSLPPPLASAPVTDEPYQNHIYCAQSRTSTPRKHHAKTQNNKSVCVNRNIDFTHCASDHPYMNSDFIDNQARLHADSMMDSLKPALPHVSGKTVFDPYTRKQALYPMPRHLLDHKSQRRVAKLDCQDDLSFPEFVQGFVKLIMLHDINNPVVRAMLSHLASLSEDITMYNWELMRLWPNTVISDIGMGRYAWTDERIIESERNRAAIFASANGPIDNGQNTCVAFNQSKCSFPHSHGDSHMHICAFCWITWGVENSHPLHSCKKRLGSNQGGQQYRQSGGYQQRRGHNRAANSSHTQRSVESKND